MAIADELIAILGYEIKGEQSVRQYESTLKSLEKTAAGVGKAIATGLAVAAGALATGMVALGKSVISTSAEFENYEATLKTIEGSAERAKQSMAWITEFATKTPFDLATVTQAFVKLKAYGIDPIADNTLSTLGDTASAMGKDIMDAVEAIADAQTGEFERIKAFGLKAKQQGDEVTFSWSQNGKEMTQTVKKSSEAIRKFMLENFGQRFGGAMAEKAGTFDYMLQDISDSWMKFKKSIGDAGFFETVKAKLKEFQDTIARLKKDGILGRAAKNISDALTVSFNVLAALFERLATHAIFLAANLDSLYGPLMVLGGALAAQAVKMFPMTAVFLALALAIDDFLTYLEGGDSVIGSFIEWIKQLTGVSDGVAQALAGLAAVVAAGFAAAFLINPAGIIASLTRLAVTIIAAFSGALVSGIAGLGTTLLTAITSAFALLSNPVGWGILAVIAVTAIGMLAMHFKDQIASVFSDFNSWLKEAIGFSGDIDWSDIGAKAISSLFEGMKTFGAEIKNWFAGLMPDWLKNLIPSGGAKGPMADMSGESVIEGLNNFNANNLKTTSAKAAEVTTNDNRQDNRSFPMSNSIVINQTVAGPAQAPGAVAQATARAAQAGIAGQRSQIETGPSF